MHQFWLTFKDKEIEEEYQTTNQQHKQWTTFKLVSFGFIVVFLVKTIQAGLQQNIYNLIPSGSILLFLVMQLIFIKTKQLYIRFSLVLLNHVVTIYFIAYEERGDDSQIAMLQGANQMAASYVLILIGEFIDGLVTLVNLSTFRIIWAIFFSSNLQYSAFISSALLVFFINYFNYQFHKARRSQYLLSKVDSHWEEILKRLATRDSYMLLQFSEEALSFHVHQENNCDKIFQNILGANYFLSNSFYKKKSLQQFLYARVMLFLKNRRSTYCQTLIVSYQKKTVRLECSIYFSNQPNILLVFKDFYLKQSNTYMAVINFQTQLLKLFSRLMNKLVIMSNDKSKYLAIERKVIILNLFQNIRYNGKVEKVNLMSYIHKITKFYPDVQIIRSVQILDVDQETLIDSITNVLSLFVFTILEPESGITHNLLIKYISDNQVVIKFSGVFNVERIKRQFRPIHVYLQQIFSSIAIEPTFISASHKDSIEIPYNLP